QSVANWATSISAGPNEASQTVSFVIDSNDNPTLFSAGPAVSSNGTLSFTPAANQNGVAHITLHAHDDGGTANGGIDNSPSQSFTITVNAVNDPPTAIAHTYGPNAVQANMKIVGLTGLLAGAADPDAGDAGFTSVLTLGSINGAVPSGGTINTTIAGVGTVTADASTGTFDFDPAPGVTGNVSFSYTVCD